MKKITMNEYEVITTVGEGAHGIVLKARHSASGNIVALKKVTLKKISTEGIPLQMIREIKALQCLEHENVVTLFDVFPQGLSFVLVFEFMPSNLWEIIQNYRLTGPQIKCYMMMLLQGLEYLHESHILHRDLKPANLLISSEGLLKVGDFGLCRLHFKGDNVAYSHQVATRWYRSPELLYGARYYDEGVDLWAAGVIAGEMLKGEPIFPGENDIDQLYLVISSLGTPDETSWPGRTELPDYNKISFRPMDPIPLASLVPSDVPQYEEFIGGFLIYNSSKRLSAKNALGHSFFRCEPLPCSISELPPLPFPKSFVFKDFDSLQISGDTSVSSSCSTLKSDGSQTVKLW